MVPPETTLSPELGPYRLGSILGRGGMGEVYKAFDERLERWVAVKRVRGESVGRPEARERFRREARTLAQLGHPAVVRIFDVLEDEDGDWIVMELVEGPTLAELRRAGPLDVGLALDYGRQIASALEAAHAGGVVHRDLKTENVMVLASGHTKILDFGLARHVGPTASLEAGPLSASHPGDLLSGRIVGTPRAMSPEQAAGRGVDARSDLFSLGVLLYEILTARLPFAADAFEETLRRVRTHCPPPVRQLRARVPKELSELVDRLLEKDPAHRPQTAAAVEAELVRIASGDPLYRVASLSAAHGDPEWMETLGTGTKLEAGASLDDAVVKTLLFSDLVGSTQIVEKMGDRQAASHFQRHDRMARDLLAQHSGREIDKTDGFLILFDRPWNAVCYAMAYHEALRQMAAATIAPKARPNTADVTLTARVGIHLGEVILHRNAPQDVERGAKPLEVEGLAKSTAARLMSLAGGGQTLLTRAAYDVARRSAASEGGHGLEWRDHGRYGFKGIGEDVEVFEVGVAEVAPFQAPGGSEKVRREVPSGPSAGRPPFLKGETRNGSEAPQPIVLRSWPPPELPEQPYPVLLPYTHPALMAGREQEIAKLRRLLELPVPILGLSAPSGTGKSSLLLGGLVPMLREERLPVALVRHPAEAGVAARLVRDLLEGVDAFEDDDGHSPDRHRFVERLCEVERLAGSVPVLVLDQFEDLLAPEASRARTVLGTLMAASVARRPGLDEPPCRWLLVYRQEFHGRTCAWLRDVLEDARSAGVPGSEALPHDLSRPERFHSMRLPPLATPAPGGDALEDATRVFLAAIEKPLGVRAYPWHFAQGHAERLSRAFAHARLARPGSPLAPELQVVLAHLLGQAGDDGRTEVPDDPGPLIDEALEDHVRHALESAFPTGSRDARQRRARALLALRNLATSTGQRGAGLEAEDLARAIGEGGEEILEKLATPLTRLVVLKDAPEGLRYVLSHDQMAEAVVRLVEEEGRRGELLVDAELLALRRFVSLRTALFSSQATETDATRLPRRHCRGIETNAEALLWDDERRAWWTACRRRRRADRLRRAKFTALAVMFLALVSWGAWTWARQRAEHRALLEQVAQGEPEAALRALDRLAGGPEADFAKLLSLLRQRETPMDVLERGLGAFQDAERSSAVLRAVEIALPWVEQTPDDPVLLANLVWSLDFGPGRDPPFAEQAQAMRDRVLEPLRRLRPPPGVPEPQNPEWVTVPAGSFLMGTGVGEEGRVNERPQHEVTISCFRMLRHEVTNAEYRRLAQDHTGDDNLPVAFINWYQAYTYAAWLGGRLPTEAEWEYAARAGCPYVYCTGDGRETTVDEVAWTLRSLDSETGELRQRPVMQLEPNPWGLYDMLGSLWELAADGYGQYPADAQRDPWAPIDPTSGGMRVARGGGLRSIAERARAAYRAGVHTSVSADYMGFRVVLSGAPSPVGPES